MTSPAKLTAGRLQKALDTPYRFEGVVMKLGEWLATQPAKSKSTCNGMIGWRRATFNKMDSCQQAAYEARLRAKTLYFINETPVPKIVFDSVQATANLEPAQ